MNGCTMILGKHPRRKKHETALHSIGHARDYAVAFTKSAATAQTAQT
jgi:hypothetical protein